MRSSPLLAFTRAKERRTGCVFYNSHTWFKAVAQEFEKKYPFIKVAEWRRRRGRDEKSHRRKPGGALPGRRRRKHGGKHRRYSCQRSASRASLAGASILR